MPEPSLTTTLLEGIERATDADLAAIDADIAAREKTLDSLRAVRRLVAVRLGKAPVPGRHKEPVTGRATGGPAGEPGSTWAVKPNLLGDRRHRVREFIKINGPKSQTKISEVTGIARQGPGCLSQVLASDWFHVAPDGIVSLTDKGDRAA